MASPVGNDPTALATPDDFVRRFPQLSKGLDPIDIGEALLEATAEIESRTSRRLASFSGHIYQDRLWGIDPEEYGDDSAGMPIDIYGSLGSSYAQALGSGGRLVRHFWVDHYAPMQPELWQYSIESITLTLTYGNTIEIDPFGGGVVGPDVTDGHVWLRLGTFAPQGTRVTCVYSGGYVNGIPPDLKRACLYQAQEFLIMDAEPETRHGVDLSELSNRIDRLISSWARGG